MTKRRHYHVYARDTDSRVIKEEVWPTKALAGAAARMMRDRYARPGDDLCYTGGNATTGYVIINGGPDGHLSVKITVVACDGRSLDDEGVPHDEL